MQAVILGCGDVGRRIAKCVIESNAQPPVAFVNSQASVAACAALGIEAKFFDLDDLVADVSECHGAQLYYTVAPQTEGKQDQRSRALLKVFARQQLCPSKVVLISTTGVYGDSQGQWVDEDWPTSAQSARAQRRLDAEQQWRAWASQNNIPLVILRVPGIYANSRIPLERLQKGTPVVRQQECGYSNRIHANDLARAAVAAMQGDGNTPKLVDIYNVSDGQPGSITEYLQAAAKVAGLPPLPEITMAQASQQLSPAMLSYLQESRRISNKKLLEQLGFKLRFTDFREGLKF